MSELQDTGGHRRGRATHDDTEKVIDPLALAAPIDDGDNSPVDLEAVREQGHRRQTALSRGPQQRDEDVNLFQGDLPSELEDDGASGPEPAHSDEFEFDPDYDDEESEFEHLRTLRGPGTSSRTEARSSPQTCPQAQDARWPPPAATPRTRPWPQENPRQEGTWQKSTWQKGTWP